MVRRFAAVGLIGHLLVPAPTLASLTDGSTLGISRGAMGLADPTNGIASPSDVGSDGAFTFRFPIEVPPGTGGMEPSVTLAYRSSVRADSVLGYGWSLELGTISRSLKQGVPSYDDNVDEFVLDGQALVRGTGNLYRSRRQGFLRIERVGDTWEVRSKDGTVSRYGTTDNSRVRNPNEGTAIFAWKLAEREDTNGNALVVEYDDTTDPSARYLKRIAYTRHRAPGGGLVPVGPERAVTFELELRSDASTNLAAGFHRGLQHRVREINVWVGGDRLRRYELVYDPSPDSDRSLLREIREHGASTEPGVLPRATRFTYRSNVVDVTQGWTEVPSWSAPPGIHFVTSDLRDAGTQLADADGDGLPDLVRAVRDSIVAVSNDASSGLYRNLGGSGFSASREAFVLPSDLDGREHSFLVTSGSSPVSTGTVLLDLDGDGRADLLHARSNLAAGLMQLRFQRYRSASSGNWELVQSAESNDVPVGTVMGPGDPELASYSLVHWSTGSGGSVVVHDGSVHLAELDGDGRPDLAKRFLTKTMLFADLFFDYGDNRSMSLNGSSGFFSAPVPAYEEICSLVPAGNCAQRVASTVWVLPSQPTQELVHSARMGWRRVDLNGDGIDDSVVALAGCENFAVCGDLLGQAQQGAVLDMGPFHQGGGEPLEGWWPPLEAAFTRIDAGGIARDLGVRIVDVNGDGLPDLLKASSSGSNVWLNRGRFSTTRSASWLELGPGALWSVPAGIEFVDSEGRDRGVRLADLDGDGMVDLIRMQEGAPSQVFLNRGSPPDLLESIENPLGGRTEITYEAADPIPGLKGGLQVVASVLVDSGQGTLAETRLVHEDGLFDPVRREFRGFETITASLHDLSPDAAVPLIRTTTTRYHQDEARAGLVRDVVVRDAAGLPWSGTEMTYTEDATPPFASLLRTVTNLEFDGESTPRRSCTRFEYDGVASADGNALLHGNLTRRIEFGEVTGGCELPLPIPGTSRVLTIGYIKNLALHLVNRPEWIQLGSGTGGAIASRSQFFYDDELGPPTRGNLTRRVDERGLTGEINPETVWEYDAYGNVKKIHDPRLRAGQRSGAATEVIYDPVFSTFPVEVVNPLGHRLVLEYEPSSLCSGVAGAVQYPAGAGLVHVERGPNDLAQSPVEGRLRCFDGFGRPLVDRAPGNLAEARWSYVDAPPVTVTRRDRSNPEATETRDFLTAVDGLGRTIAVLRSAPGPAGQQTTRLTFHELRYDAGGRIVRTIDPYYAFGTPPPPTVFSYDPLDRVIEVARPGAGRITTIEHLRGLRSITDPNEDIVRQQSDAFGDIVELEDAAHELTHYEYDAAGRLTGVRDPRNNETWIRYDQMGQRTSLEDPNAGARVFGYDANGNLIREQTAIGTTTWIYDALDRPKQRDTGPDRTTWVYDTALNGKGRLKQVSSSAALHAVVEYDLLGRPLGETTVNRTGHAFTFENQYDPLGQLLTRTYPHGRTLEWVRDPRGFLKEIRSGSDVYADLLDWDARGQLTTWRSGRQAVTTQGFDPETGLLESIVVDHPTAGTLLARTYGHDPLDRIDDVIDAVNPAGTRHYEYDPLGRLALAERPASGGLPAARLHYGYDALGNLLCKDAPTPPTGGSCTGQALTYPAGGGVLKYPHIPLTVGGLPAAHDSAGNLKGVGGRSFLYNALGQLVEMRESSATRATFDYGPEGDLVGITEATGATGSQGQRWLIAPDFDWNVMGAVANVHVVLGGRIVATHAEAFTPPGGGSGGGCAGVAPALSGGSAGPGGLLALFAPGLLALLLAQLAGSRRRRRAVLVLLARAGRPATAVATAASFVAVVVVPVGHAPFSGRAQALVSAGLVFYHADHLGSAVVVHTDTLSFQHAAYEPFGQSVGSAAVPEFGFTGQRFVTRTGLYHYGARWYDPAMGRFLQPDPLVPEPFDPQSLNRYSYVLNDPVNRVDPTGLQPQDAYPVPFFAGFPGTAIPDDLLGGIFVGGTFPISSGDGIGLPPAGQPIFDHPFPPITPTSDLAAQAVGRAIASQGRSVDAWQTWTEEQGGAAFAQAREQLLQRGAITQGFAERVTYVHEFIVKTNLGDRRFGTWQEAIEHYIDPASRATSLVRGRHTPARIGRGRAEVFATALNPDVGPPYPVNWGSPVRSLQATILHEYGHFIGMDHPTAYYLPFAVFDMPFPERVR